MNYPKLPGLPTTPGWYWRVLGDDDEPEPYFVGESTVQWYASDCGPSEFTWYGPIPPPTTGEREPCAAWEHDEARNRWTLGNMAAVFFVDAEDYQWNTEHKHGDRTTLKAAQLAAEDAVLAECAARMAVIMGGTDHAR